MTIENAQALPRRAALALLAGAGAQRLAELSRESGLPDEATLLRGPETGLVALRGRIGGGGAAFNFGEATVTRASVKLATGEVGHSYALGRDREKARLAAVIDALRQRAEFAPRVNEAILLPLAYENAQYERQRRNEAAATRVEFFTVARGED